MKRNSFLNFICACIPGVGFMYNGLIKKGISVLVLFMLAFEIPSMLYIHSLQMVLGLPIWFYSFFTTFDVYKRINNGEYIDDKVIIGEETLENIIISKNFRKGIGIVLIVLGVFAFIRSISEDFNLIPYFEYRFRRYVGPVALIALGIFILMKSKNHNTKNRIEEVESLELEENKLQEEN
ncbi:hypothetical protein [Clostridium cadaveris]|uniref:hypothetical protein n=1 Tax=Clostridium cadaveris TaxID=1529 RepID=UPI0014596740|nr:hypothetical protein [Clostridium cadaveris]NME63489.1 hypothetical protein [Clostridium cadaveris]NWK09761.1 hypothetical protein [Clostridium cadaveris]UFH64515.1 hypothetical protein KQH81_14735 [Clostridium cadaveris]